MGTQPREVAPPHSVSSSLSSNMLVVALLYSLLLAATAERVADDWVGPFQMPKKKPSIRAVESVEALKNSKVLPRKHQFSRRNPFPTERSQPARCEVPEQRQGGKKRGRSGPWEIAKKEHNSEASWWWQLFEHYGVELDQSHKVGLVVFIGVWMKGTEVWSKVLQFVKFNTFVTVGFFTSILWNWVYLVKVEFGEQQKKMTLEGVNEKCSEQKNIDWTDILTEWLRSTWTLQDDPCRQYYDDLFVSSILKVPPTKAISVTVVMFITEPLIGIGEGISGFFRALLSDLPLSLQFSVFILVALVIVILVYATVQKILRCPAPSSPTTSKGVATIASDPEGRGR